MTGGKGTAISTTVQSKVELALKAHLPYGKMAPLSLASKGVSGAALAMQGGGLEVEHGSGSYHFVRTQLHSYANKEQYSEIDVTVSYQGPS
jgi:hypothetical protein